MGLFGDILGGIAKAGMEAASNAKRNYDKNYEKFSDSSRYSDRKLDNIRRDTSRSMAERAAANKIYKERNGLE